MTLASVPLWASIPFALILLSIAVIPLINRHFWDKYYYYIAVALGLLSGVSYVILFKGYSRLTHTTLDYFSFIVLLGSLFVVTGGINIRVEGRASPVVNAIILFIGAVISNIIGTTGASMLLIRPYLRLNSTRHKPYLVVFFIFIVSNIGGALTPIGDPPLFLGYLKGVPFFWVISNLWPAWLFAILMVIGVFLVFDYLNNKIPDKILNAPRKIVVMGWRNFIFLILILVAVFLDTPWRELVMICAAAASYIFTPKYIHKSHNFNFKPIIEVAVLFFGIFATMMPTLDWLEFNAQKLGLETPGSFFWASGSLSAFLDNAPTYLSFLSAAIGLTELDVQGLLNHAPLYIKAISLGAVFFGAVTYIGNGPNFMVKSISEHNDTHCPSFFGYMIYYSIPILLPVFFLVWLIFLR